MRRIDDLGSAVRPIRLEPRGRIGGRFPTRPELEAIAIPGPRTVDETGEIAVVLPAHGDRIFLTVKEFHGVLRRRPDAERHAAS